MTRASLLVIALAACGARSGPPPAPRTHDVVIRHGLVVDGTGAPGRVADVAIDGDRIVAVGDLAGERGAREIDATGLVVAPGFVNMLSHSEVSLIADGKSQGELREGVTLEVFGEFSMGPVDAAMKKEIEDQEEDIKFDVSWTTLGGYLDWLAARGIATNVASFVGAGTVRQRVMGHVARAPTDAELEQMRGFGAEAMDEGALGVTTALMYEPDTFARTSDLVELAKVAAAHGGVFTAHIRDEGDHLDEAVDEILTIAREARIPVEIFHFKQAGKGNWSKLAEVVARIEKARAAGLHVTADMYTYVAAATGLDGAMPRWVQEGGLEAWRARLRDPATRAKVKAEMDQEDPGWDNAFAHAGADGMLLVDFKSEALRPLIGKTLAQVAKDRGESPEETAMDLVIEDDSRVGVVYTMMSEDNIAREVAVRAPARPLRARPARDLARGGGAPADLVAVHEPRAHRSRHARARLRRRRRDLRCDDDRGSRDVREAAPVRDRHAVRAGRRRDRDRSRRAHRRDAGPHRARARLEAARSEVVEGLIERPELAVRLLEHREGDVAVEDRGREIDPGQRLVAGDDAQLRGCGPGGRRGRRAAPLSERVDRRDAGAARRTAGGGEHAALEIERRAGRVDDVERHRHQRVVRHRRREPGVRAVGGDEQLRQLGRVPHRRETERRGRPDRVVVGDELEHVVTGGQ